MYLSCGGCGHCFVWSSISVKLRNHHLVSSRRLLARPRTEPLGYTLLLWSRICRARTDQVDRMAPHAGTANSKSI